jgi:hypothetical protein
MQTSFRLLPVITLAVLTSFTACKKEDSKTPTDSKSELTTHADDQNRVSSQLDAVANDVSFSFEGSSAYSGRLQSTLGITTCDATVSFDSLSNPRKITITYNGSICNGGFKRTGSVVASMPANVRWKDQGATITVAYQNLKVTRLIDNKSITINGSHTITNISGGLLFNLSSQQSITHDISSAGLNVSFDDNTQRSWQVANRRVFTYNNGIVLSIRGNHTIGTTEGVAEWGVNRFGNNFTASITQDLVIRQDCSFRLTSGQVKHSDGVGNATVTFGLDVTGQPVTCPNGFYYFKVEWTGPNGATANVIWPY